MFTPRAVGNALVSFSLILSLPGASAHVGAFHRSMFCFNGPQSKTDWNTNTVVNPLYMLPKSDYWFGNGHSNGQSNHCYNWPPEAGQFLELPAGGSFDIQFANNRAFTTYGPNGGTLGNFPDGQNHPEYDQSGYYNSNCVPSPLLHTQDRAHVAGSAFAISYHSDYSQVTPENMVVFSVAAGTPWHSKGTFQVPENMPKCPSGGCLCGWGWVPNNCGQPNMYLQLFRCKVTGAKSNAPKVAAAKPAVWCENNPSACTKGAKQMIIWHQAEGDNINTNTGTGLAGEQADGQQKSPAYASKLGWSNGAQNDIFESTPDSGDGDSGDSSGNGNSGNTPTTTKSSSTEKNVQAGRLLTSTSGSGSSSVSATSTASSVLPTHTSVAKVRKSCVKKKKTTKHTRHQIFRRNSI